MLKFPKPFLVWCIGFAYSAERIRRELGYNDVMHLDDALRELVAVWRAGTA